MTTLVLHIGSPKAGSSALQASLAAARWRGGWRGLPANPYGKPYPSGFIAGLYLEPRALPRFLAQRQQADAAVFARDLARYRRLLARCLQPRWRPRPRAVVLSCEYLWRLPQPAVAALRRDFEALGVQRFLVVAYVREPAALYGSALQQWSRLSTELQRFDPSSWRYELRRRLDTWAAVFHDDLLVRPCDRAHLVQGSVVADLQQLLEQQLGADSGLPSLPAVPVVNGSASTEELVAMQELMLRQPGGAGSAGGRRAQALTRLWEALAQTTREQPGSRIRVKPAVQALIRQRHQADLDWLEAQHGLVLPPSPELLAAGADADRPLAGTSLTLADLLEAPQQPELLERLRRRLAAETLPAA